MIASDVLDLLLKAPVRKSYTNLTCMACQLKFENGVGDVEVLYLNTPGMRARGGGSVDLDSENIDMLVHPQAKRPVFKSSSTIRVSGPLSNPSAKKVPAKEAGILAAQVTVPFIALPGRLLGHILSLIRDDKDKESPCLQGKLKRQPRSIENPADN